MILRWTLLDMEKKLSIRAIFAYTRAAYSTGPAGRHPGLRHHPSEQGDPDVDYC